MFSTFCFREAKHLYIPVLKKVTMRNKRGQSAGMAGIFVAVIGLILIFYILFLTPEDRAELLGDTKPGGSSGTGTGGTGGTTPVHISKVLLSEHIGRLDYIKTNSRQHDLPSFRISTVTDVQEIKTINSIYVKNGVMDKQFYNFTFDIDTEFAENLLLSFNVKDAEGRLIIYLNGNIIVNTEMAVGSPPPVALPQDYLGEENLIQIAVSGVGWAFWDYNEYLLENVKVTAKITDISGSSGAQRFYVSDEEYNNIDEVKLRFYPDCKLNEVGPLTIRINGVKIYSGIGDCGTYNIYVLGKDSILSGENTLTFSTDEGSYLIDRVQVIVELEELVYPVYYFEIDDKYFTKAAEEEDAVCGEVDGICPDDCTEDEDKDCCFEKADNYWCDLEPSHADDRCVSAIDESECQRCRSGYEDEDGSPPEECEDLCGDDTDDSCPIGCSMYYDQDCCYEVDADNYWCDDVPTDGLESVCEEGIDVSECDDCTSGYENEDGDEPDCPATSPEEEEEALKTDYDVTLKITFVNRDDKKADVNINGHIVRLDTDKLEWTYKINDYVRSDTNSIEIIPKSTMDIANLEVKLEN